MSGIAEPGLFSTFTIDGVDVQIPNTYDSRNTLRQAVSETSGGRVRLDIPYDGVGLPDALDTFEWAFDYDIDDTNSAIATTLETLRTAASIHLFTDWKKKIYRWTATSGQTVMYLQRQDPYGLSYAGHTALTEKATVKINGSAISEPNTLYAVTTSGTSVAAGKVSISTVTMAHPDSGAIVNLFKFGTALSASDVVTVESHQLYRVIVTGVPTKPFSSFAGREDKALVFLEAA